MNCKQPKQKKNDTKPKKRMNKQTHICIMGLVSHCERVFGAASHKKVWDHFTKAQRKNIDLWKKQSLVCTQNTNNYLHFFFFIYSLLFRFHYQF